MLEAIDEKRRWSGDEERDGPFGGEATSPETNDQPRS